jgi:hypothetical protein
MRLLGLGFLLLFASACTPTTSLSYATQLTHHDNGTPKPKVALVPIFDHGNDKAPFDLSHELTQNLFARLFSSGKFYLTLDFEVLAKHASPENNPFVNDIEWIKESASPTEFLVFVELMEHRLTPNTEGSFAIVQSYTLEMSVRVKILDLRTQVPKIILQELFQESFHIPWRFSSLEAKKGGWNKAALSLSLISSAHTDILKKIALQIEDYVLLAKWQ